MPELNPQVAPTQATPYVFWSRPIQQPMDNKSTGTALKGLGDAVKGLAETSDETIKSAIDYQADQGVDKIRDDHINRLQTVYQDLSGKGNTDILGDTPENLPPEDLQRRLKTLDTLDAAKQSGKYSETYLQGQYIALAKDLRSNYSGYRDYIDEKIDKSTGRGVANKYVSSLQSDVNSYLGQKDKLKDKLSTQFVEQITGKGNVDLYPAYQRWISSGDNQQAIMDLGRANAQTYQLEHMDKVRTAIKGDAEVRAQSAREQFQTWSSGQLGNFVHEANVAGLIDKLNNGSTPERQAAGEQIQQLALVYKTKALAYLNKKDPNDPNSRPLIADLGGKSDELLNEGMTFFNSLGEYAKDEKMGPIASAMNNVKAREADVYKDLVSGPLGPDLMAGKAINQMGGQNTQWAQKLEQLEQVNNLDTTMKTYMSNLRNRLFAQNSVTPLEFNGQPIDATHPMTFSKALDDAKAKGVVPEKVGVATSSKVYSGIVGWIHQLTDKDTPAAVKENIITGLSDPSNKGFISKFKKDYVDPTTGKPIMGQASAYAILTSPGTDKAVFTTEHDPKKVQNYIDWKKSEFAHTVFPTEINDLNHIEGVHGKFGFDTKSSQLVFEPSPTRDSKGVVTNQTFRETLTPEQARMKQAVWRLNLGLANMHNMATKYTHEDPNAYVLSLLGDSGLENGPVKDAISKAVKLSLQKPEIEQ